MTAAPLRRVRPLIPKPEASTRSLLLQLCIGLGAVILAGYIVVQLSPDSWWFQSGLDTSPGDFVAALPVDYPVCASWKTRSADFARHDWELMEASSRQPIAGNSQMNRGLLLPKTAKVVKIYCAAGDSECSWAKCNPPMTIYASDSLYTRGRALVLTLINNAAPGRQRTSVHVWVLWHL